MGIHLGTPVQVGKITLKNRIMMAAIHHLYAENSLPSPRFNEYYWERAEGGAGLVVVGACRFDQYGARKSTLKLDCEEDIIPHSAFVKGMHERDCRVALQLYHAGRYMRKGEVLAGGEAIAPSPVYTPYTKETAREMTRGDIERVISGFATAAARARRAGYDAVEISASAGYLLTQFLSPLANIRADEYGGDLESRARFPLRVLSAVRMAVGGDYTVILRLGGHDLVPGSNGSEECRRFAVMAAETGLIDMISLTGGWHESRIPQLTGEVPRAGLLYLAGAIKKEVGIPIAMANRMGNPRTAMEAVALGRCDIVAMGRPLIADPALPGKVLLKKPGPVRPCVACNQGCLAGAFFDRPVRCLVNGMAGREYLYPQAKEKSSRARRLLVIGAGPAGCEFSIRAAQRGHAVTLCEKSDSVGGQLRLAAALPAREEFAELLKYYEMALERSGVELITGFEVMESRILGGHFNEVIFANGRLYGPNPISVGEGAPPVYTMREVIEGGEPLPGRVAVIGGSFVGLETARMLARGGSLTPEQCFYMLRYGVESPEIIQKMLSETGRHVAVFEKGKLGGGYEPGVARPVLDELNRFNAALFKDTEVLSIAAGGVVTKDFTWACGAVVVCPGTVEDNRLYDAVRDKLPAYKLGNARKLGRAADAVASAVRLVMEKF